MNFVDLLDEYLAAKKIVDTLRDQYNQNQNQYLYKASFNNYYYAEVERYQEARNRLNDYVERKSLSDTLFGG